MHEYYMIVGTVAAEILGPRDPQFKTHLQSHFVIEQNNASTFISEILHMIIVDIYLSKLRLKSHNINSRNQTQLPFPSNRQSKMFSHIQIFMFHRIRKLPIKMIK